ncbi:MAG: DNA adenine methylase [Candidatus Electrothrix sp. MAN1_4]|nr:DNA adenine methylase [Candidatus Electrothrix sp. MAN1_4]
MEIEIGKIIEIETPFKKVRPPFGYFGSKNKMTLKLCENLPPHYCWVEAFCGSAALTLAKRNAPIEIINDVDGEIVNLFKQLRNNHEELCKQIEFTPYAEQELVNARIKSDTDTDLERARKFLVQSMMAINGVFGAEKGGFSSSNSYSRNNHEARVNRWNNLPDRLEKAVKRLKSVRVDNKDARKLLNKFINRPATLVYLDPPYLGERTNGYNIDANDENFHSELLHLANKANCMIFISGYENELYKSILSLDNGWSKKTIEATTRDSTGHSHTRTEVVWMNKYFISAQNAKIPPIELTNKELKENKLNPERPLRN